YYKVSAVNSAGEGDRSSEVSATPSSEITVPSTPQNFQASAGDGQVELNWDAPSDSGGSSITEYKIYRGTSSDSLSLLTSVTSTSYTDQDVSNGETYYYQISAVNGAGEGEKSSEVNAIPSSGDDGGTSTDEVSEKRFFDSYWWIIPIIAVIVIALVLGIFLMRKKGEEPEVKKHRPPPQQPLAEESESARQPTGQVEEKPPSPPSAEGKEVQGETSIESKPPEEKLEDLKKMKEKGLISEEDFEKKKNEILEEHY
ncbi:MAG: fibronectin type III domain-containing protein, partial [Candidatus Thermoplasmatota archaeon]